MLATNGEVEDYLIQAAAIDLGDLPDTSSGTGTGDYDTLLATGPSHVITADLGIGALIDAEADGQPNGTATGDDTTGLDDEDGFTAPAQIVAGQTTTLTVDVTNTSGSDAVLYGFVDWNNDGDFDDAGETVTASVGGAFGTGTVALTFTAPLDAVTGVDLGTRFRLSTDSTLTATGAAPDGEVEDYLVQVDGLDLGDLPDTSTGTGTGDYDTLLATGPSHVITADLGIGALIDAEADGQPNSTATGDDTTGLDDEDGFTAPAAIIAGQTVGFDVVVSNNTGSAATLYGFVDWNADGDFDDAGETVTASVADGVTNATETLTFTVPLGAVTGTDLGTRFRLSTDTGLAAGGTASNGEVEDYLIQVNDALLDYGDLPDGPYPTLSGNSGPSHVIDGVTFLGATVDAENNGQPNASATGDDTTGAPDDEDGVVFLTPFVPGGTAQIQITTSSPGALSSFIDFDGDGTLDAVTFSAVAGPGALPAAGLLSDALLSAAGVYVFDIDVPLTATGEMASRFRFTATAGEGGANATGAATSGEVEDYLLASIGDFVFNDNNLDGTQDGGDTPQAGVTVNLLEADGTTPVLDGDGNPVTTVTDASGNYIFSGVPTEDAAGNPIDYTVEFENPAGTLFTSQIGPVTDPTNSDADTTTGVTGTISVNPGDAITYVDAGLINLDYGDLPEPPYAGVNDASHAITTELQIGSVTDAETAAQPNATATGDDTTGVPDDEDGFTAPAAIVAGQTVGFDVVVSNNTGSAATLYGFVDWNADGDFDDAGETVTASVADGVTNATETLTFTVPLGAVTGTDLGTRFRLSTDTGLAAGGTASNGEVEDYLIQVNEPLHPRSWWRRVW